MSYATGHKLIEQPVLIEHTRFLQIMYIKCVKEKLIKTIILLYLANFIQHISAYTAVIRCALFWWNCCTMYTVVTLFMIQLWIKIKNFEFETCRISCTEDGKKYVKRIECNRMLIFHSYCEQSKYKLMPYLRLFNARLALWRFGLSPRWIHVLLQVDEVALEHICLFLLLIIIAPNIML
jgi:hypothetical protein